MRLALRLSRFCTAFPRLSSSRYTDTGGRQTGKQATSYSTCRLVLLAIVAAQTYYAYVCFASSIFSAAPVCRCHARLLARPVPRQRLLDELVPCCVPSLTTAQRVRLPIKIPKPSPDEVFQKTFSVTATEAAAVFRCCYCRCYVRCRPYCRLAAVSLCVNAVQWSSRLKRHLYYCIWRPSFTGIRLSAALRPRSATALHT